MKKIGLVLLMAVFAVAAFGQKKKNDKICAAKIEFIKKKLALTADEEKKFTPLYNAFSEEGEALRTSFKSKVNLADIDLTFMTDEECQELINSIAEQKQKELDLIKKYTAAFKKILPVKKVAMIFKAEYEFKRLLVRKLRGEAKKMREEARKIRKEHREMLKDSRALMKDSKLSKEERKKMREESDKLRKQIKEEHKRYRKQLQDRRKKMRETLKEIEINK